MAKKQTGICWITFYEGVSDEKIMECINNFYAQNSNIIEGMEFNQLKNTDALRDAKTAAREVLTNPPEGNEGNKAQKTLV